MFLPSGSGHRPQCVLAATIYNRYMCSDDASGVMCRGHRLSLQLRCQDPPGGLWLIWISWEWVLSNSMFY